MEKRKALCCAGKTKLERPGLTTSAFGKNELKSEGKTCV